MPQHILQQEEEEDEEHPLQTNVRVMCEGGRGQVKILHHVCE
jgi:hypothetical protein